MLCLVVVCDERSLVVVEAAHQHHTERWFGLLAFEQFIHIIQGSAGTPSLELRPVKISRSWY